VAIHRNRIADPGRTAQARYERCDLTFDRLCRGSCLQRAIDDRRRLREYGRGDEREADCSDYSHFFDPEA
jgi:hypothetical protein